jgi:hypothetical protein
LQTDFHVAVERVREAIEDEGFRVAFLERPDGGVVGYAPGAIRMLLNAEGTLKWDPDAEHELAELDRHPMDRGVFGAGQTVRVTASGHFEDYPGDSAFDPAELRPGYVPLWHEVKGTSRWAERLSSLTLVLTGIVTGVLLDRWLS